MKSILTRQIEILESRIAPARTVFYAGIPNTNNNGQFDSDFDEAPFVNTEANPLDPISGAVGAGLPGVADTFYLRLSAGQALQVYRNLGGVSGNPSDDFISVQSGNIVVFFIDKPDANGFRDNEVSETEIVGISASDGARFELRAALSGDVVYNLINQGTPNPADDTLLMAGPMNPSMDIGGFTVASSLGTVLQVGAVTERVGGKVLASGNISNVVISGDVGDILAGSAANLETFDFFPKYLGADGNIADTPGGDGIFSFSPAPGKAGSRIQKVIVDSVSERIESGVGGDGAKGGDINNVLVRDDLNGFEIKAGGGGTTSPLKKNGGKGGSINAVYVSGAADANPNDSIRILAGEGGNSDIGVGGAGGKISKVFVGYTLLNGKVILSNEILRDTVAIEGGAGGSGKIGGKGGAVSALDILVSTPESFGDEISVIGGEGGRAIDPSGGKAGIGGSITSSIIRNAEASIGSDIGVRAGDGGISLGNGLGANGGSVTGINLLGRQIQVSAGDGTDGKKGGKGGSIASVIVEQRDGIVSDALAFDSGLGGDGTAGNGGKGGDISRLTVVNSDFNVLEVNSGIKGNGGDSIGGRGGLGGKVTDVSILDTDANATKGVLNLINVRSGSGGDGDKGGGNGGEIGRFSIVGVNLEPTFRSGSGGDATLKGKGGNAGNLSNIEAAVVGTVRKTVAGLNIDVDASAFMFTGTGGNGAGVSGAGGAGGNASSISVNTPGSGLIVAGSGGSGFGANAAAGRGGSIISAGVFAGAGEEQLVVGEGQLVAGDAGAVGARPGNGGSVIGTPAKLSGLFAKFSLTVTAGDGTAGGSGGSITNLGYGSTESTLSPTPKGNILIQAGNGSASADGKYVGKGGSILNVGGAVNSDEGSTIIRAGDGGGAQKKAAAGGSITGLALQRGGEAGNDFSIRAGDGGDAPLGAKGGAGGSVTKVNILEVSKLAILRHIAAGDGGDALKVGGKGGSVSTINVLDHDIGVRSGELYGFETMGGIFAGVGGAAGAGGKEGVNGNVTTVNADAISSIVAGRGPAPKLAGKVENIYLNGADLLKDSTGAFLLSLPGSEQVFVFGGTTVAGVEQAPGTGVTPEVQTINLAAFQGLAPGKTYYLTYGGENTAPLAGNADAAAIETALRALDSVRATGAPGSLTVTGPAGVGDPTFTITFSENGDRAGLISATVDPDRTAPLALTATPAEVQTALNALGFIQQAGSVTVTLAPPGGYKIVFNTPDNQPQIVGLEVIDFDSVDLAPGIGNSLITVTETLNAGSEVHSFFPFAPFKFSITYSEAGELYTTAQLPASATADEVRLALEALPTIDPGEIGVIKRGTLGAPVAPAGGFDVQFNDLLPHPTLQVTMYADPLTVTEGVAGSFENLIKEKQVIYIDPLGGGDITFSFGLDSFLMNVQAGITAQSLSTQLNLQPSIVAQGGVTVVSPSAGVYEVTFGSFGEQLDINVLEDAFPLGQAFVTTQGSAVAPLTSEVVRFSHVLGAQVRFGFNGLASALIAPGAGGTITPAQIDAALEAIPGIGAAGVTVSLADADNSYNITFAQKVNQPALNVAQGVPTAPFGVATTTQIGTVVPAVSERQVIRSDDTGVFRVGFGGVQSSYAFAGASVEEVQALADAVLAGTGETVAVTAGADEFEYIIEFVSPGPKAQFIVDGVDIEQTVQEVQKGAEALDTNEVQVVEYGGVGEFALHVPVSLTAQEMMAGGTFSNEVQRLSLSAVRSLAGADFTLSYGVERTAVLASDATASAIQIALNALPSITLLGGVTVSDVGNGNVDVRFTRLGDRSEIITGQVRGGVSTPLFQEGATLSEISDALNALTPIVAVGGVRLESGIDGQFSVIFNNPGQMPSILGFYQVREVQELDFYKVGEFAISYGANPEDITSFIPAGSSTTDVAAALNSLPAIIAAGGVTVSGGLNSRYEIQFNNAGDVLSLHGFQQIDLQNSTTREGNALTTEEQKILKPRRFVFDEVNAGVANYVGGFSDASEIEGRTFKWVDSNGNGLYEINEVPLDGLVAAKVYNQAKVNFTAEARITGGTFGFSALDGSATEVESQLITIKADKYTLSFGGERTIGLTKSSSVLAIQNALNALASIQATGPGGVGGSVQVSPDSLLANTYTVEFAFPGNQAPISAPFFYDYNNIF